MNKNELELELGTDDILTEVHRFNLIREGRLIYIDVHETLVGRLAAAYVAVPNLVNIVARQEFQGTGENVQHALRDCLQKIKNRSIEELFPRKPSPSDQ